MLSRTTTKGGLERSRGRGCGRAHWSGNNQAALIEPDSEVKSLKKGCDRENGAKEAIITYKQR